MSHSSGPRLRLLAYPDVRRVEPDTFDIDIHAQRAILRLVNAASYFPSDHDQRSIVVAIARLVSPSSVYYRTEITFAAIVELANMRGIFIWLTASDLSLGTQTSVAPYAVALCVLCEERYRAIAFARMLTYFLWIHADGTDHHPTYTMVNLCFRFDEVGVVGVIFFDQLFESEFQEAREHAVQGRLGTAMHDHHAVTFWPPGQTHATVPGSFSALLQRTRDLYLQLQLDVPLPFRDYTNC